MIPCDLHEVTKKLCSEDALYQEVLEDFLNTKSDLFTIRDRLNDDDQFIIDHFVDVTHDLKIRLCQLVATHYAIHGADAFQTTSR